MPLPSNAEAERLFRQALAEFAPGWTISAFGRADSESDCWRYDASPDQFGATVERID